MKSIRCACLLLAGVVVAGANPANAVLIHDYEFTTGLNDSVPGGAALEPSFRGTATGSVANGFYTFDQGAGLTLGSQLSLTTYTIDIRTSFDAVTGYRKLISFNDLSSDNGLYILDGGLDLYSTTGSGPANVVTAGTPFTVRLTRDGSSGLITGYLDGVQQFTYSDTGNLFLATSNLWFLRDDTRQNREDSAGSADFIRIFDDTAGVDPAAAVPEPASWAMMIAGFGLVGAGLRQRRRRTVLRYA